MYETWAGMGGEGIVLKDPEAVMLELSYKHPRTAKRTPIRQAVRIALHEPFELKTRKRAQARVLGVMPSGMLRHPLFVRWR